LTIVRDDGSRSAAPVTIADTAPGFWTAVCCRGPALGEIVQTMPDGRVTRSPLSECVSGQCRALPVKLAPGVLTRIRLAASGFRHAPPSKVAVTLGGIRVPVVSYKPSSIPGTDDVTIEIPANMVGLGETDLLGRIDGRISNAVRIRLARGKPLS
jgi:hypothetical protein